jgi:hypothetical protein
MMQSSNPLAAAAVFAMAATAYSLAIFVRDAIMEAGRLGKTKGQQAPKRLGTPLYARGRM